MSLQFGQNHLSEEKLEFEFRFLKSKIVVCIVSDDEIRSESLESLDSLTLFEAYRTTILLRPLVDGKSLICNI